MQISGDQIVTALIALGRDKIKMTDLDPEIFDNPTLGAAAPNVNLDQVTAQEIENRAAKFEKREPREIVVENNYPGYKPEVSPVTGTVSSNYQTVHFADEQQADIPVDSGPENETAGGISESDPGAPEVSTPEDSSEVGTVSDEPKSSGVNESGSADSPSSEEGNNTQWS
jgi:hypothetical protein